MSISTGVVFTKPWVVDCILDLVGYTSDKELWKSTIIEPSFGEGAFLEKIIKRLFESFRSTNNSLDFQKLKNSIRAYEVDSTIFKTGYKRLLQIVENECKSIEVATALLDNWLVNSNFLVDKIVQGDYVVGNPPYISASQIDQCDKEIYKKLFSAFTSGTDIYIAFFEKSLQSLKNSESKLCFICSDRWMQNQYGKKLRKLINDNFHLNTVIRLYDVDAFETKVSAYPAITLIDSKRGPFSFISCNSCLTSQDCLNLKKLNLSLYEVKEETNYTVTLLPHPKDESIIPIASPRRVKTILELVDQYPTIEETGVNIGIGLATGKDSIFLVQEEGLVEDERMLPAFNMKLWRSNNTDKGCWIINPWDKEGLLIELEKYPKLKKYLESNRTILEDRYVAKKNPKAWYRTIDKVKYSLLEKPKLLFPDLARKAKPIYSEGGVYPCHDTYWMTSNNWDLKVLGGLLMSEITESFIDVLGVKMRGNTLRFQAQYLKLIHLPKPDTLSPDICLDLKRAFITEDYVLANEAALKAYGVKI